MVSRYPKNPLLVLMASEVLVVDLGRDPPDRPTVAVGDPGRPLGVLEERVLLGIELVRDLEIERPNIRGISLIDAVHHVQEVAEATFVLAQLADFDRHRLRA
jgi:hypothetical protein